MLSSHVSIRRSRKCPFVIPPLGLGDKDGCKLKSRNSNDCVNSTPIVPTSSKNTNVPRRRKTGSCELMTQFFENCKNTRSQQTDLDGRRQCWREVVNYSTKGKRGLLSAWHSKKNFQHYHGQRTLRKHVQLQSRIIKFKNQTVVKQHITKSCGPERKTKNYYVKLQDSRLHHVQVVSKYTKRSWNPCPRKSKFIADQWQRSSKEWSTSRKMSQVRNPFRVSTGNSVLKQSWLPLCEPVHLMKRWRK